MECVIAEQMRFYALTGWVTPERLLTGERDSLQWPKLVGIFFSENLFSTPNDMQ